MNECCKHFSSGVTYRVEGCNVDTDEYSPTRIVYTKFAHCPECGTKLSFVGVKPEPVFCIECTHYSEDSGCWHPGNMVVKSSWLHTWEERESPSDINKNNNCKWYKAK
jgi:hypothetical protein